MYIVIVYYSHWYIADTTIIQCIYFIKSVELRVYKEEKRGYQTYLSNFYLNLLDNQDEDIWLAVPARPVAY